MLCYEYSYLKNILIDIFILTVENENSGGQTIGLPKNIKSKQETSNLMNRSKKMN